MADQVVAPPAAPAVPAPAAAPAVAPSSPAEFQAAALALFGGADTSPQIPAAEPAKPAEPAPAPAPAPAATKPAEPAPAEPVKPPLEPEQPKGFDALVREKAALRKREAELQAREEKLAPMLKAFESRDGIALLSAAGLTYDQLVKQLVEGKKPDPAEPRAADPVMKEVQALRQQLQSERAEANRARAFASVVETVRAEPDKFKFTAAKKAEAQAVVNLERYFEEVGELPVPGDFQQSLRVAAEAVEANLRREAESWRKLLTPENPGVTTGTNPASTQGAAPKEAVVPAARVQASPASPTLTNATEASKPQASNLKTPEDYQRAALALLEGAATT